MPVIGNDITICKGSSGTRTINISNKSSITHGTAPYRYSWLLLNGGEYTVLANGTVDSLLYLEDYNLDISQIKSTSILRLEIIGSLNENNDSSIYLFDDKEIIVQKPNVSLLNSNVCEDSYTIIYAEACNIDNSPYTYSYVYNDPLESNYNALLINTTEWMSADSFILNIASYIDDTENKEINVRVRIKDVNNDIQESDNLKINVINMGTPALPTFKYLCNNGKADVTLELDGMDESNLTYNWFKFVSLDSSFLIQDSINKSITFDNGGIYYAAVYKTNTTGGSCIAHTSKVNVINMATVDPNVLAERNYLESEEDSILLYFTYPFNPIIRDLINIVWLKDNTIIDGATKLEYWAKEPGMYRAVLYDLCNFETNSNALVIMQNTINVKEIQFLNSFSIYPNPTNGNILLSNKSNDLLVNPIEIRIYDINGKVIYQTTEKTKSKIEIDISDKLDGIYFLKMTIPDKNIYQTSRIIKIKN
ncbi:MAG: T9SS type A sorting domain-containing protein [Bacteroidota bacterium]